MRADTAAVIVIVILGALLFMETHEGFRRVALWTIRVLALLRF
jgi:type IV secretory pathway VirB2 component (pilin)